jgi:hypothetical protein
LDDLLNNSSCDSGIERIGEEAAEEADQEERKKEEERRDWVTLDTASWACNMSDVTNSLDTPNKDINNEISSSPSPDTSRNWNGDFERPDTHISITFPIPDADKSSIDRPISLEILNMATTNTANNLLDSKLKVKESEPTRDSVFTQDCTLLASALSRDINSPTPSTSKWRTCIPLNTHTSSSQHDDEPT